MATLDATLGGPTSNSYVDVAFADAYAANKSWATDWAALTEDQKEVALITSTSWMETLSYAGTRCSATQALKWPRSDASCDGVPATCDIIPLQIQQTEVELAWQAHNSPDAITGGGGSSTPTGVFVKRQKLGSLEVEYDQFDVNTSSTNCRTCDVVISAFPWLKSSIGCWLGGNGINGGFRPVLGGRS